MWTTKSVREIRTCNEEYSSGLHHPKRLRIPVLDDEGTGMKTNWDIFHMVEPSLLLSVQDRYVIEECSGHRIGKAWQDTVWLHINSGYKI